MKNKYELLMKHHNKYGHDDKFYKMKEKIKQKEQMKKDNVQWLNWKKLLLIFLIAYFLGIWMLVPVVDASFLPVKSYNEEEKLVTIKDFLGLGSEIAKIKLETPINYQVGLGYQKVAEFEVNSSTNYDNAIKSIKLFNLNDNSKEVSRKIDIKYKDYIEVNVTNYKYYCPDKNNFFNCYHIISGYSIEKVEGWKDLNSTNINKGEIIIGLFTNVKSGDYIEWIPDLYGFKINEWATWTGNFSNSLLVYYKLDETSGLYYDSMGLANLTNVSGTQGVGGIIDKAFLTNGVADYSAPLGDWGTLNLSYTFTINTWEKIGGTMANQAGILCKSVAGKYDYCLDVETGKPRFYTGFGGYAQAEGDTALSSGVWYMLTGVYNGTHINLYVNGILNATTGVSGANQNSNINFTIGNGLAYYNGTIDESSIWNRSLSSGEILLLYNSGDGCQYGNESCYISPVSSIISSFGTNPVDNYNDTDGSIIFDMKCSADNPTDYIQLFTNTTGTWTANYTNTSYINNTWINYTINDISQENNYKWAIFCNDTSSNGNWTDTNRTFNVDYLNVDLLTPINTSNVTNSAQTFTCNATAERGLENVTFFLWNSTGGLVYSETRDFGLCYQETANVSTDCGGLSTGNYGSSPNYLTYDGNWGTSANNVLAVTYRKPINSQVTSLWQVKDGAGIENLSIFQSCWDYDPDYLFFYKASTGVWFCYNITGLHPLRVSGSTTIYEEAMWWNMSNTFVYDYTLPHEDNYTWNCQATDVYAYSEMATSNYTLNFLPNVSIENEYNPSQVLELSNYIFNITIQRSDNLTEITPTFYYNNTGYDSGITTTTSGANITYTKVFNIPYIINAAFFLNKSSYWSFDISYGGSSHLQNSTVKNITNHEMALLNLSVCADNYTIDFYNVSYKDETLETALININNTWNLELFNPENTTITRLFNGSITLNKTTFCVHYATADNYFKVRAITSEIDVTNYLQRKDYICENANTTSSALNQYLLNSSVDYQKFYFNVKDKYQASFIDSYIYFYKWQSNQWLYIGSEKTDTYGNAVMRLVEDKSYKIIIKNDECEILKEMELTLSCQSLPCQVDIILSESQNPYQYLDDLEGFTYVFDYDKDTKIEIFDYTYIGSDLNSVNFATYKKSVATVNTLVCSDSSYSSEDTFTCNVSNYSTGSFISYAYVTDNDGNVYTLTYTFDISIAPEIFGKEGLMWGILIMVVLFFAFIFNPVAAIFATVMGAIALAVIGFVALPWLFIVLIIVVAGIIIVKLKT